MYSVSCSFSYYMAGYSLADRGIQTKGNWTHGHREQTGGSPEAGKTGEGIRRYKVPVINESWGHEVQHGDCKLTILDCVTESC